MSYVSSWISSNGRPFAIGRYPISQEHLQHFYFFCMSVFANFILSVIHAANCAVICMASYYITCMLYADFP